MNKNLMRMVRYSTENFIEKWKYSLCELPSSTRIIFHSIERNSKFSWCHFLVQILLSLSLFFTAKLLIIPKIRSNFFVGACTCNFTQKFFTKGTDTECKISNRGKWNGEDCYGTNNLGLLACIRMHCFSWTFKYHAILVEENSYSRVKAIADTNFVFRIFYV